MFFPTFVWVNDLAQNDAQRVNEVIMGIIDALMPERPEVDHDHSWQSDHNLHEDPAFGALDLYIRAAAAVAIDSWKLDVPELVVTGAWANISPPGAWHHEHSHPNNILSGVYYIKTPKGGDRIWFEDPRPQAHVIAPPVSKTVVGNASQVFIDLKPGRLVLFPAWLRHSVKPNAGGTERVSVAFNLMAADFTEKIAKPRWKAFKTKKK